MIEQLNTIDYDDEEFVVNFYDTLYTDKAWTVNVQYSQQKRETSNGVSLFC